MFFEVPKEMPIAVLQKESGGLIMQGKGSYQVEGVTSPKNCFGKL